MNKIIAIANHKGGVGKTTTTFNLAGFYAQTCERRVLVCDLDPQASLTRLFRFNPKTVSPSLSDVLLNPDASVEEAIHETPIKRVFLIPATNRLKDTEKQLVNKINREKALARLLEPLAAQYDHVFLDCPPALDLLNTNGLSAADAVIVPMESSTVALQVVNDFMETVEEIRREVNPRLALLGIFITKHQSHTSHSRAVLEAIEARYPGKVFQSRIPHSVQAKDSAAAGLPIFSYSPRSAIAAAYEGLANEVRYHA